MKASKSISKSIEIEDKIIGGSAPCYIIVELSCNHEGNLAEAIKLIEVARQAGADAVKLQTYKPETITRNFGADCGDTMWGRQKLYDLYSAAQTPWDWHKLLRDEAHARGLHFFSSPFDETAVDLLESLEVPAYKIASFEIVDTKLLEKVAKTGKPVIFSTGMSTFLEIQEAYSCLRSHGCEKLALLHCNSGYPPPFEAANLNTIPLLDYYFDAVIGLSDHTLFADAENCKIPLAHVCPIEAVKLGAKIIEVHLTLDRDRAKSLFKSQKGGFDWSFSRNPAELTYMIKSIRNLESGKVVEYRSSIETEKALAARGKICLEATEREIASRDFRPVLWAVARIEKGDKLKFAASCEGNFDSIRGPNIGERGLHVRFADFINGRTASRQVNAGSVLTWEDIEATD